MLKNAMIAHVKELVSDASSKALESKVVALSVAATTAALGRSDLQSAAQLYATLAGGLLTTVLAIKHGYSVYRDFVKDKEEDARKKNENISNQK